LGDFGSRPLLINSEFPLHSVSGINPQDKEFAFRQVTLKSRGDGMHTTVKTLTRSNESASMGGAVLRMFLAGGTRDGDNHGIWNIQMRKTYSIASTSKKHLSRKLDVS
jgi:hypothetical protein